MRWTRIGWVALGGLIGAAIPSLAAAGPHRPAGLRAAAVSEHEVALTWRDLSAGEVGFTVERRLPPRGRFAQVAITAPDVTALRDDGLEGGTRYRYRVRALAARGLDSPWSQGASVVTLDPAGAPTTTTTSTTAPSSTSTSTTSTAPRRGSTTTSTTRPPNHPPVAAAGPDQFTQTLTAIPFSAAGSRDPDGSLVGYAWTFGDGATAAAASATHAYAAAGVYTVTLTVTDDSGITAADTAVMHVSNRPPVANAGSDQAATPGAAVALSGAGSSDADGRVVSFAWAFGDGGVASGPGVLHAFASPGTYTVTLTVTDDGGATASDTAGVTVTAGGGSGQVVWGRRIGGTGYDEVKGIAVDGSGNVIVTGEAVGPIELGAGITCAGSIFVARYDAGGGLLWARCPGSAAGGGGGRGVAVDASGNVVVTGYFRGTVDFGGGQLASPNGYDIFLVKYSAAGAHLWSKRFGGPVVGAIVSESGADVAVDAAGNVVVTGSFEGTADFGGGPLTSAGQGDVFLAKYSPAGTHLWSRRFGGTFADEGKGLALDASGNVVLTGAFYGAVDFGGGLLAGAGYDVVLAKYSAAGTHLWSERFGGALSDEGRGVAVDGAGNVLVTGAFQGAVDFGGGPLVSAGGSDGFVAKYSAAGTPLWSRRFGGTTNFDAGTAIAVDAGGNAVATGFFAGTADFGAGPLASTGSKDAFVARYSATGVPVWSRHVGGTGIDAANAVAIDGSGAATVGGLFFTAVDLGAGVLPSAGGADMFLVHVLP
jgi:PKD repeat protein